MKNIAVIIKKLTKFISIIGACSCTEKSIEYLLRTNPMEHEGPSNYSVYSRATIIVPGGASEVYNCKPRQYRILLDKRKGFIRLALQSG